MTRDEAQESVSFEVLWVLLKYLGFVIFKLLAVGHMYHFQSFENTPVCLFVLMIGWAGSSLLHRLCSSRGEGGFSLALVLWRLIAGTPLPAEHRL